MLSKIIKFCQFFKNDKLVLIYIPYMWMVAFFVIPFLVVLKISFSLQAMSAPPFSDLLKFTNHSLIDISINLGNYINLVKDSSFVTALLTSLSLSALSTFITLILGFSIALSLVHVSPQRRLMCLVMIMMPFCISFLIRIYAWISILSTKGIINTFLMDMKIIQDPLFLTDNIFTVCLGVVYCYLPFMILPIYNALEKIEKHIFEASANLGAKPFKTLFYITIPLAKKGIISGIMLVFVPSMGEFVIPELLGGPDTIVIGRLLWMEFFNNLDWPQTSALAISIILLFVFPVAYFQKQLESSKKEKLSD
ncbi:MAG: putrescine ABC transporter permease PotH [Candidatus Puniceispirillum sp.]|nr:putrescine ABC transporter permease PotH [Candidatus Pelagibacter sp.]MBA4282891.1 putrescine ABC transporter permease PotH [Candidatus Puniceispirillum sp.]